MEIITGYKYVAIVNLIEDKISKDYGFALYDEDMKFIEKTNPNICTPVYLLVNARNKYTLAKLQKIVEVEEYEATNTIPITKEVICFCDDTNYNNRKRQRNAESERKVKEAKLRTELDNRISKLKDMDYYKRMADELGSRDSELKSLVGELMKIVGK